MDSPLDPLHPGIYMPGSTAKFEDIVRHPLNLPMGKTIHREINQQLAEISKQATLSGVPEHAIITKILESNKPVLIAYLKSKNLPVPASNNALTMAATITTYLMQNAANIKANYFDEGENKSLSDCFDEYLGSLVQDQYNDPNSPLHYSNTENFANPDTDAVPVDNYGAEGEANLAVSQGIESLGKAASQIPGFGAILGPALQGGGAILSAFGAKKRAEGKRKDQAFEMEMQAMEVKKKALQDGKKQQTLFIGLGAVIVVVILVFAFKK